MQHVICQRQFERSMTWNKTDQRTCATLSLQTQLLNCPLNRGRSMVLSQQRFFPSTVATTVKYV
jgi:hypothetical protein